jgi:hypothetical protein
LNEEDDYEKNGLCPHCLEPRLANKRCGLCDKDDDINSDENNHHQRHDSEQSSRSGLAFTHPKIDELKSQIKNIINENDMWDGNMIGTSTHTGGIVTPGSATFNSPDVQQHPTMQYPVGQNKVDWFNSNAATGPTPEDVKKLKHKVTPDEIIQGVDAEMKRMFNKNKSQAKAIVVKNLKQDPKYYSQLHFMGIEGGDEQITEVVAPANENLQNPIDPKIAAALRDEMKKADAMYMKYEDDYGKDSPEIQEAAQRAIYFNEWWIMFASGYKSVWFTPFETFKKNSEFQSWCDGKKEAIWNKIHDWEKWRKSGDLKETSACGIISGKKCQKCGIHITDETADCQNCKTGMENYPMNENVNIAETKKLLDAMIEQRKSKIIETNKNITAAYQESIDRREEKRNRFYEDRANVNLSQKLKKEIL